MTGGYWQVPGRTALLPLDRPPRVSAAGVGVHGTDVASEVFRLPGLWQFHLYGYEADLVVDGEVHRVRPGCVSLVPPGAVVEFRYGGRSEHLYVHFATDGEEGTAVPVVRDAATQAPPLRAQLRQALAAAPVDPRRTDAEVWAALWRAARLDHTPPRERGRRDALATAFAYIEDRLSTPLTVPEVAAAAGVSHNHLIRLFRAATGLTVVAYIRRRRLELAGHLLRESTLSIPAIAATVGIADLHTFNKACRRELGASPRAVRGR
ncbi:AraC family transcriptional regulator [Streptomyces sp. NPDC051940]|uniref:AraC family transcriptional regulator n=1 Tax=Streptomyces sp. NPDC051940 TaxID=3155675 RepID=UPI0034344CC7